MMSTNDHRIALPDDLTAPRTKLVYLTLSVVGEATVAELQRLLGLSKLTLLPILTSLRATDHVQRTERGYANK
ncbi:hypothetical protein [Halopiger djelfimassiliensis]|uniref:hypothetical protein n=1 Tax=Halopiger djelfimassiliensis TaxID=1293047 RepID=UPI000677E3F6|nr:hypothetical protein [Halopiger djelfimassiliensis]